MISRSDVPNAFEFVVMAGARARQLQRGCEPRTTGSDKVARLAALEIKEGHVEKQQPAEE